MVSRTSTPSRARTSGRRTQDQDGQGAAQSPAEQRGADAKERHETHSAMLRLPFLKARFEIPQSSGAPMHLGPMTLPSPEKTVYYVGLGLLAVAEVIEWPVAAAIAAGTYVAQHTGTSRADQLRAEPAHNGQREPATGSA
ncbi:hypothetical protein [Parafrankia sp. FMc2]|uniref:hypothetical protein n=1 Tax=Parafrankia sp. FMc2 TaxID=3233196 RepID=UPI0034D483D3